MLNDKIIIGLGYKMYSGKDTVADYWQAKHGIVKVSFAAKLKAMVRDLYNLTSEHTDGGKKSDILSQFGDITARDIMQKFGQYNREIYEHVWVDYVFNVVIPTLEPGSTVVITDCRYPNEVDKVKENGGYAVNIIRDTSSYAVSEEKKNHLSEISLDGYDFDFVIDNDGSLEELYARADFVFNTIIKNKRGHLLTNDAKTESGRVRNGELVCHR